MTEHEQMRQPGRPPRWREVAGSYEEREMRHPGLPWDDIARAIGIDPRLLREYRRILRSSLKRDQEQAPGTPGGQHDG